MNCEPNSGIDIGDAARRVGAVMYGDEWIGDITEREKYLISRYVEGYRSLTVAPPKFVVRGRDWVEYPSDPILVVEVERARDRRDWREHQFAEAYDWLDDHNFHLPPIDSDALARELHRCFSQVSGAPAKKGKGGHPPVVDWTVVERETLRLMDYNGDFGADSPEWNVQARLEEKLEAFCDSTFKKRPVKSTLQFHFKPWLDKWRAAKGRPPET
jgi:hypothetical protein